MLQQVKVYDLFAFHLLSSLSSVFRKSQLTCVTPKQAILTVHRLASSLGFANFFIILILEIRLRITVQVLNHGLESIRGSLSLLGSIGEILEF